MKISFNDKEPMTPEREIQMLRDIITKFAHSVGFASTVQDLGKDAAYWRALHEGILSRSHERNTELNQLREDKARLDWLDAHQASVEVNNEEVLTATVQASDDFSAVGHADPYDIRKAIDDAMDDPEEDPDPAAHKP